MTTMKAHTPGPWKAGSKHFGAHDVATPYVSHGDTASVMCFLNLSGAYGGSAGIERAKADAALIASAPDLLAERDRLKEINAELLEALVMTKSWLESEPLWNAVTTQPGCETFGKRIVTAISRATVTSNAR